MTPPPDRFGAHDRTLLSPALLEQMLQPCAKLLGERIVGIVVEAFIRPVLIDVPGDRMALGASPPKSDHVLVRNPHVCQCLGKRIKIELRVGSRSRKLSDVYNTSDFKTAEQADEVFEASIRMAN